MSLPLPPWSPKMGRALSRRLYRSSAPTLRRPVPLKGSNCELGSYLRAARPRSDSSPDPLRSKRSDRIC
jgi:hypothetical protein